MTLPEFSHILPLDRIGDGSHLHLEATPEQCAALAKRFGLIGIDALVADIRLIGQETSIELKGRLHATATQICVASAEPVPATIDEAIAIRFVPAATHGPDDEIELATDDCDIIEHDGLVIDVGEAVAQSFGLALNPFPRSPDAEAVLRAAGVKSEHEVGAFSGLSALRDRMMKP
jgi:uncharacterized metal-binding protein YceD (DUF177 family)